MADPYNPYTSYSTPTPGGVGYYPPEEQTHFQEHQQQPGYQPQQPYGNAEPQANPIYGYAPHPSTSPSPYHLAPEAYQGGAQERSYTPIRGLPANATDEGSPGREGGLLHTFKDNQISTKQTGRFENNELIAKIVGGMPRNAK
ncbi:hypothetical protein PENSUB_12433 [Penicillium subrubescens]|uniref:Uncharacterized protein n=1 Tax=Penicillium subrubescens TaxID=1316194 RepID=A0A1Q5SZK7_9EURO|nr:hypothetical protein PENSUB_12433 [Penicillium subrubescens]